MHMGVGRVIASYVLNRVEERNNCERLHRDQFLPRGPLDPDYSNTLSGRGRVSCTVRNNTLLSVVLVSTSKLSACCVNTVCRLVIFLNTPLPGINVGDHQTFCSETEISCHLEWKLSGSMLQSQAADLDRNRTLHVSDEHGQCQAGREFFRRLSMVASGTRSHYTATFSELMWKPYKTIGRP